MSWSLARRTPATHLRSAARHLSPGQSRQAFYTFAKAAHAGNAEAAFQVGRGYLDGKVVPVSLADAAHWLERAAGQGHVEAQALLAELLLQGLAHAAGDGSSPPAPRSLFAANTVGKPDFPSALIWSRRAAEAGSANGQALLAYILSRGPEMMRDQEAARTWYECAARGGSAQGHLGYALAISGQPGQEIETVSHLRKAAEHNLPAAIYLLGVVTERGMGTDANLTAATSYYRRAAEAGHHAAQSRWGAMLMDGTGVQRNPLAGETWLRKAALAGDPGAAARVGQIYATAGDVPANYAEAAIWFERAARAGHRSAAHALGLLYLSGSGVPFDAEEAARWFRVAASEGNVGARNDLARLVLKGAGTADDLTSMLLWFKAGAEAGDHVAEFNYAICLAKGLGGPRNDLEATRFLRRAAPYLPSARYWYGLMMAEGRGVPANLAKARRHFSKAAAAGQPEAATALGEMLVNGRGGPRDPAHAVTLFKYAAAEKHTGAMFALGIVLTGGHGIQADLPAARGWFLSAAQRNHAEARQILARFLTDGVGGEKDVEQARFWLEDAMASAGAEAGSGEIPAPPPPAASAFEPPVVNSGLRATKAKAPAPVATLLPVHPKESVTQLAKHIEPEAPGARSTLAVDPEWITVTPPPAAAPLPIRNSPAALPMLGPIVAAEPKAPSAPEFDPEWITVPDRVSTRKAASPVTTYVATGPNASPPAAVITVTTSGLTSINHIPLRPTAARQNAVAPVSAAAGSAPAFDAEQLGEPFRVGPTPLPVFQANQVIAGPFQVELADVGTSRVPQRGIVMPHKRMTRASVAVGAVLLLAGGVASQFSDARLRLVDAIGWLSSIEPTVAGMTEKTSALLSGARTDGRSIARPETVWGKIATNITTDVRSVEPQEAPPREKPADDIVSEVMPPIAPEPVTTPPEFTGESMRRQNPGASAVSSPRIGANAAQPASHHDGGPVDASTPVESSAVANVSPAASTPETESPAATPEAVAPADSVSASTSVKVTPPVDIPTSAEVEIAPAVVARIPAHDDPPPEVALGPPTIEAQSAMTTPSPASKLERPLPPGDVPSQPQYQSPITTEQLPSVAPASSEVWASMLNRGEAMLRQGDVLSARMFFERAAEKGSGRGAIMAGKTYDPNFLAATYAVGIRGDAERAIEWYRKAWTVLGDQEAKGLLNRLMVPTDN